MEESERSTCFVEGRECFQSRASDRERNIEEREIKCGLLRNLEGNKWADSFTSQTD